MSRLHRLSALGQSVWIDYLSRDLLESGGLARAIDEDAVVGVTSNPTIFDKALSAGATYDGQIAAVEGDAKSIFLSLAATDVAAASDLLRPSWERTSGGNGYVSIEVDPNLAHNAKATIAEATMLHEAIDRPNVLVKIPATDAGLRAIEEMTARGRSINVTLIFSLTRHRQVIEAYLRGLERLVAEGGDPRPVHSVASFFVSRVDTEADRRLAEIGRDDLKGQLGIANAKLAYQQYKELFSGERWKALSALGATKQRCLWASTSTKDPSYRDTLYVEELIGPETISTMPEETIHAFQQHGRIAMTLERGTDEARSLIPELAAAGVDYEDVVATLEREGIDKFVASFHRLLEQVCAQAIGRSPARVCGSGNRLYRKGSCGMSAVPMLASIGTTLGLAGAACLLLQARRLLQPGTACEISIPIRLVSLTGYGVWLAYGIAIQDLPLILVDLAGLVGASLLLRITFSLRRRNPCSVR